MNFMINRAELIALSGIKSALQNSLATQAL